MNFVKPKKKFGQHFLKDKSIAEKVATIVPQSFDGQILEIGPGTGVLTRFLLQNHKEQLFLSEIDSESVSYLKENLIDATDWDRIIEGDFLKIAKAILGNDKWFVIGNFPYNISSQILFKILENRTNVEGFGGMFQREVARRICSAPDSKEYGILSVLMQAYYKVEYCFTVSEDVFNPPPKVKTGVIKGFRYRTQLEECSDSLLFDVVKTAFNQRRKTLNNCLKKFQIPAGELESTGFAKLRPENLSVEDFIKVTQMIEKSRNK
ncbi:MAG: 16S rRNA (adenine(1518)-N(6)/adenine(1519)-N(6))-dimethyltransferase RsmA [Bacteroidia bacterium]|nr:ribosomal RNA small subunit methyltransferase A [Bacteroidia bacterium]MCO5252798.1 16S rRNA (adenine(1518)-N(6)/adenine(1519)-N(6))-dimethyltransferase RsmA [Bacteroidota bacterium]MCZ2129915.1 16S rRNA (adenine(1518)-N(6)/adenine(1519)-N(6))-dimethyltransferase RsmA [Bacteroidia bacterium]